MKSLKTASLLILSVVLLGFTSHTSASHLRTVITLSGHWQFNIGDEKIWATPQFDDSKWDKIIAPTAWEKQGYVGYDGFAWYRKKFTFPDQTKKANIYLQISNIDDVDEIYINGRSIGRTGQFPPQYESGYGFDRLYQIPEKFLNFNGENTIAIRVYDDGGEGGIVGNPVRLAYNEDDEDLIVKLTENWKFSIRDKREFKNPDFNDSDWKTIKVPQNWQSQGYWGYNGYAWYRLTFELNGTFDEKDLYLVLGKIDDFDEVYLNGKPLGRNWPFSFFTDDFAFDNSTYSIIRGYRIPRKLLQTGNNTIAIRVFDHGGLGGIYEGPVGIMKEENFDELRERNNYERNHYHNFNFNFNDNW